MIHLLLAGMLVAAAANAPSAPGPLEGEWQVDLRPTPEAPEYLKPMRIELSAAGGVTGSFYDSPMENGTVGEWGDRRCVSFRTRDASGPYHSSACLSGERLVGQTWSEGRGFLLLWTARRP